MADRTVAVAGGTGLAGARVVDELRGQGDEVVVLSRGAGIDVFTGHRLDAALEGVDAVVDCTSTRARDAEVARRFFGTVASNLQTAAARAGVRRVVTLSIVGLESMAARGHYAGKLAQEWASRAGPVPATILRAAQFHDFGAQLMRRSRKGWFVPVPIQPVQTVDLRTVAAHLVRLGHGADEGATVHLAGPQRLTLAEVVRRTARARGERVVVVPVWLPGPAERAARAGAALPPDGAILDGPSFDAWLGERP
ncbi:MAG TPA: NAD(P)H-binding protein [Nocardioides sp.]|uniref:SDR family oxidoreductase n=1 Tax=Nocardioides sp. TaxID=35761 RepID=UPI002F3F336B